MQLPSSARSAFFVLLFAAGRVHAADCTPDPLQSLARFDAEIGAAARVVRAFDIPAGSRILIEARETGTNFRVELLEPRTPAISFDNALRRWAPQRHLIEPGHSRRIELAIQGQERSHGGAQVRLYLLGGRTDPRCLEFWRATSTADAAFSRAEMISGGKLDAPDGSADLAYASAAKNYARAVEALRDIGGFDLAQAQLVYGVAELIGNGAAKEAAAASRDAQAKFEALGNAYGRDRARFFLARAQMALARRAASRDAAIAMFTAASKELLAISDSHSSRGERYDSAFALSFASVAQCSADGYAECLRTWQRASDAFETQDEPARKAQARQGLAYAEFELGRFPEAIDDYTAALRVVDPATELELYEANLVNLAFAEYFDGRHGSALRHYSEALDLSIRMQSVIERARALHGLGVTYHAIGNYGEALLYLQRALELRTVELDSIGRVDTLRGMADVLRDQGMPAESLARREEAMRLATSPAQRARIAIELARDQIDAGNVAPARAAIEQVLADTAVTDAYVRTRATFQRARIALIEGRLDAAARDADAIHAYFRTQELVLGEFGSLMLQARVACARSDRGAALRAAQGAMRLAEEIRTSSNNPTLRAALWKPLRPAFDFTVGVLAERGSCGSMVPPDPLAALAIAEQSRNRALGDFREQASSEKARDSASLSDQRRVLFEQIAARHKQIEALADRVPQDDARLRLMREDTANLRRSLDLTTGGSAPGIPHAGDGGSSLRASIEAVPAGAVVIEYWLGEQRAYAWLVSRKHVQLIDLGPTDRIDATARRLHEAMRGITTATMEERVSRARELYTLIIAPLPVAFTSAHTVYFIPDGALHAVPFAALASGEGSRVRFVVDTHDVAVAPSLSGIALSAAAPRLPRDASALVIADPVYTADDSRLVARAANGAASDPGPALTLRGGQHWTRLPSSAREADAIAKLLPPGAVVTLSGFDASRESLLNMDLSRYRIVHFAGHAIADTEAPQLSALILSTFDGNGKPRIGEVFAGDLLDRRLNADLVVLSGCDTAMGQASAGEGLLGMRYAAHAAGARTVIASLWPVVDAAGAQLMDGLYSGVMKRGETPIAALSQAMRSMRAKWSDPALWSVFDVSTAGGR